jgi:hypothetical protein
LSAPSVSDTFAAAHIHSGEDPATDWLTQITRTAGLDAWQDAFDFEPAFVDDLKDLDYLVGLYKSPAPTKGPPGHPYGPGGGLDYAVEQWYSNQSRAYTRLLDWIRSRTFEVVDGSDVEVEIPLFLLSAPTVNGCDMAYSVEDTTNQKAELSLTFFGNGIVADTTVECKATSTFSAAPGEIREVFVPMKIRPRRVTVLGKGGAVVGTGLFAEPVQGKDIVRPGVRRLTSSPYTADASKGSELYPLSKDIAGAKATYETFCTAGASYEVSLGFKAFNNDHTARLGLGVQRSIKLESTLRGGHDYRMSHTAQIPGVVWEVL